MPMQLLKPYAHIALHTSIQTFIKTHNQAHFWSLSLIQYSIIGMSPNQKLQFYNEIQGGNLLLIFI